MSEDMAYAYGRLEAAVEGFLDGHRNEQLLRDALEDARRRLERTHGEGEDHDRGSGQRDDRTS
jgi:exonuclease VII small subunit